MDEQEVHEDHGHSVAAWVGVCVIFLGFLVGCVGTLMANLTIVAVGAVIMALGLGVGVGLAKAGYGAEAVRARRAAQENAGH